MTMKISDLPEKQQWELVIDTIASEKNAFSIKDATWGDFNEPTQWPDDSFPGECGTPACIMGWSNSLGLNIYIPDSIYAPTPNNSNAMVYYNENPKWFTRAKSVAMLKHYVATSWWDGDGKMLKQGNVDWRLDEKPLAKPMTKEKLQKVFGVNTDDTEWVEVTKIPEEQEMQWSQEITPEQLGMKEKIDG